MSSPSRVRALLRIPADLLCLAYDWLRVAATRVRRLLAPKRKRTCPFCHDLGYGYTEGEARSCHAAKKYGNPALARRLCRGLRPAAHGTAPFECTFERPAAGPSGSFFRAGLAVLAAGLALAVTLQVTVDFFPRAAGKARRVLFGPTLPEGLADDPALRELQIRLLKLAADGAESNPELAAQYEAEGDRHFAEESFRMARLEYAIANRLDPESGPVWHKLGMTYLRLGSIRFAQQAFEQELEVGGDTGQAHRALAITHALDGRRDRALEHAITAHQLSPEDGGRALLELLEIHVQRRDAAAAATVTAAALEQAPDDPQVLGGVARAALRLRELERAEACFRQALEADPDHLPALLGLAETLVQRSRPDEADTVLRRALALSPGLPAGRALAIEIARQREGDPSAIRLLEDLRADHPDYTWATARLGELLMLAGEFDRSYALAGELAGGEDLADQWTGLWLQARLFFAQGLYKKAIEVSQPLIERNRYALEARLLQAQALLLRQEYRAAVSQLSDTTRLFPDCGPAYLRLCEALVRLGDPVQAERLIDRMVEQQDGSARSYKLKGDYHMLRGDQPGQAREAYETAMERAPEDLGLQYDYVLLLADQLDDLPAATRLAESLREAHPGQSSVLDLAGWLRFREGRPGEALPLLEQAVAASPQVAVFRHHLGIVYHHLGRTEDAQRQFRAALTLHPGYYGSAEARELLEEMDSQTVN